ncbi:GGDEF domain-containing protein [Hydrogenimonas sp.]|uniref:GGDEF domain-containing protein n=1 Tax=Hydrogenimonas sp. TaxID=2231112 RepID=UPI002630CA3E|nr:GGDEF domain-containing protein [Hydrogenimonas sp.]
MIIQYAICGGIVLALSALLFFLYRKNRLLRTDYEKLLYQLKECRSLDEVTGAYNYAFFVKMGNIQVKLARRKKWPVSMLIVDVIELEKINIRRSYAVGNAVLKHLYQTIKACIRESDIIGRFGGSGFFILLNDCAEEDLPNVIMQIQSCLENSSCVDHNVQIPYKTRFGGVTMHGKHIYLNTMLSVAEEALHAAKTSNATYAIADHTGAVVKTDVKK